MTRIALDRFAVEFLESRLLLATYYVASSGSDTSSNPSSLSTPYKTIQKAASVVNPGDTVIVQPGAYYGPITLTRTGTAAAPITFKADAVAQNRVIITNANKAIREKTVSWTLVDPALKLYSAPLSQQFPSRVLYDGVDLLPYQTLNQLKAFKMGANLDYPGTPSGYFHDTAASKLYVRLRADEKYGSVDPNQHIMAVAPKFGGGGKGYDIGTSGTLYTFGITPATAAHVTLDGFSFETPGVACVYVRGSHVTVRNCWFRGAKTGVAGRNNSPDNDTFSSDNVVVEYCDWSQFPAYDDAIEIINQYAATWFNEPRDGDWKFFWWQRKGQSDDKWLDSNLDYESPGITEYMGKNWTIRYNHIWETFDGIASFSMAGMDGAEIYGNLFERIADNAIEFEDRGHNIRFYNNEIKDVFMPISWQPLAGTPWPTDIWVYKNLIYDSPGVGQMWKDQGQYRGAWLKIGAAEKQWAWYPWMANVPKSPVDPGGQGVWFYNNTVYTPAKQFLEKINSNSMNMIGVNFYNNVFVCEDYYGNYDIPANYWTMSFSHNVRSSDTSMPAITENHIAGAGGVTLRNPAQVGLTNAAGGNFSLTSSSPARALGVAVPNRPASEWSTDAGAVPYGTSWVTPTTGPQTSGVGSPPSSLNATAGNAQVALVWAAAAGAISYNVKRSLTSGGPYTTIGPNLSVTNYTDTGVVNGTTYHYVVTANFAGGTESVNSPQASASPAVPVAPPGAPTGLGATSVSASQINLAWTAPAETVSGYNIYRGTVSGQQSATPINSNPISATSYSDLGLSASTTYFYKVVALNSGGAGAASAEASATTQSAPAGTSAGIDFDVASDYTNNFREMGNYTGNIGWNASGVVTMSHTDNWRPGTAIYDTTPADGQTTINAMGGTSQLEQYSLDFRVGASGLVKLFARIANPSVNGGYYLYADMTSTNCIAFRIPTTAASPDNEVNLAETLTSMAVGSWYTLQFTLQNNAGNTAVVLTGKLFPQGSTAGAPLATVNYTHSSNPYTAAGQTGFTATSGGTSAPATTTTVDNFVIGLPDTTPPTVVQSNFNYLVQPNSLSIQFSEMVQSGLGGLTVESLTNPAQPVSPANYAWDAEIKTATFGFAGTLPDGNYRAALVRNAINDPAGNALVGTPPIDFFALLGDANHDRRVNALDFNALATHFGQSGRNFSQGNFDGNNIVNTADFTALASRFGTILNAPAPSAVGLLAPSIAASPNVFSRLRIKEDDAIVELLNA